VCFPLSELELLLQDGGLGQVTPEHCSSGSPWGCGKHMITKIIVVAGSPKAVLTGQTLFLVLQSRTMVKLLA